MATTFGKKLVTNNIYLYPQSIGKIDKKIGGTLVEERGVYTFQFQNGADGASAATHNLTANDICLCPLMDYEFTTDMMIWFKRIGNISDTSVELGWYGQNDESIISDNWVTLDADGITTVDPNPNQGDWGSPRLIDFDAFDVDTTASSMQARHTAIGLKFSTAQSAGAVTLKVKIMPYRA